MNWIKLNLLLGACLGLSLATGHAQTNINSAAQPVRDGQVVVPDKLTVNDANVASNLRPDRPERASLPPEVQERIQRFRNEARVYLNQQQDLKKQLEGANDRERAAIRDRIRQLREQWLERSREMRKQLRERQQELMEKLPDYREVIQSARDAAQDAAVQAQQENRRHRGED
jgi:hypothetical protein